MQIIHKLSELLNKYLFKLMRNGFFKKKSLFRCLLVVSVFIYVLIWTLQMCAGHALNVSVIGRSL